VTPSAPPPRAGRREWIGLAVIALPCMLYSMDLTVLNVAVPHLSADLKPSSSQLLWIVDIYGNAGDFARRYVPGMPRVGVMAIGSAADLILVPADPRMDLGVLSRVRGVIVGGQWLDLSDSQATPTIQQ
jgi:hypothetical protein